MKKIGLILGIGALTIFTACDVLEDVASTVVNTGSTSEPTKPSLTNEEVIRGLKEALTVGIKNGASLASMQDGFFKNPAIFIPWPEEAVRLKDWGNKNGFSGKVTEIETSFNRAAEEASKKATPIFVDAITNMSVSDGFAILKGADTAATMFLQKATSTQLKAEFKPVVHNAIETVKLTQYWEPVAGAYNKVAMFSSSMNEVNTDLDEYVTDKGMEGLFYLVKQEERKIRKNPAAQVTDLLKKVFGSLLD
jgi:hypothetical protein